MNIIKMNICQLGSKNNAFPSPRRYNNMKLGNIFRGPKWPRDAAEFIATHFADKSVTEFFDEPRFERFLYLAKTETWVEAAREYRDVTGEDIQSSIIAAEVARRMFR